MRAAIAAVVVAALTLSCGAKSDGSSQGTGGNSQTAQGGAHAQGGTVSGGGSTTPTAGTAGTPGGGSPQGGNAQGGPSAGLTYWGDVAPIFASRCWRCHQAGGIGPDILSTYDSVSMLAMTISQVVSMHIMPPWPATDDGSCGTFVGSLSLTEQEINTITTWAAGDKAQGTPVDLAVTPLPMLADAVDYHTPDFTPMPEGTALAPNDEYRCFLLDPNLTAPRYITGYDVLPGNADMIHHVIMMQVDPTALSSDGMTTNGDQIAALDADSPDRLGWPCFGMAGDGVEVNAVPVTWAMGQGVVTYPDNSGIPVKPTDRFVVQVHYNMDVAALVGQSDTTTIRLHWEDTVQRIGVFALHDPLLESLSTTPVMLASNMASVPYTWQATVSDLGLGSLQNLKLQGVMPHMHKLGHTYSLRVMDGASDQCGIDVKQWNIMWQRLYFYQTPFDVSASTQFQVTCDYNTQNVPPPILPGWGTSNEMCLAVLYFTADAP